MIPILFDATETEFGYNGLGRLRDCLTCEVTEERNGIFELDFTYPIDGINFDKIRPGRIVWAWHDATKTGQPFDIVSCEKPLNGIVSFHAVHVSYRQSGLVVTGTGINSLADAFAYLRTSEPANPFTYLTDKTTEAYLACADGTPRSVRQTLGGVEGSILDSYGGEYEWNVWQVFLHRARGVRRNFAIRYGINLIDYSESLDAQGTYNSCVPFWKGQNDQGAEVIVVGDKVTSQNPTYNGQEICVPLDLTDKFESPPTKAQLQAQAQSYMQSAETTLPAQTIKVDFINLADLEEYKDIVPLLQCGLCDTIQLIFPQYNVTGNFKIVKTVYDCLSEKYTEMELGNLSKTLSEALGLSNSLSGSGFTGGDLLVNDLTVQGGVTIQGAGENLKIHIDTTASASTTDGKLYSALTDLGWGDSITT